MPREKTDTELLNLVTENLWNINYGLMSDGEPGWQICEDADVVFCEHADLRTAIEEAAWTQDAGDRDVFGNMERD